MSAIQFELISENSLMLIIEPNNMQVACRQLQRLSHVLYQQIPNIITEQVPAYNRLLISYQHCSAQYLINKINNITSQIADGALSEQSKIHELAVCYDLSLALDLESLAIQQGLSNSEVIELHTSTIYQVFALGFAPGFAYLGNVHKRIAAKRHATPRSHVPAGSVGIADRQTAIYPKASPGGWQIIGRSPAQMFNVHKTPPCPIQVGDSVRFVAISLSEYKVQAKNNLDFGGNNDC